MDGILGEDLVCFRGDRFQAEIALWEDDFILKRLYSAWQAITPARWSEAADGA